MPNRRSFLRSAFAAPLFSSAADAQDRALPTAPARVNDPAYWSKVRDQFLLARDKVFFNNGTIGAMPKPVVDRMTAEIHRIATGRCRLGLSRPRMDWRLRRLSRSARQNGETSQCRRKGNLAH